MIFKHKYADIIVVKSKLSTETKIAGKVIWSNEEDYVVGESVYSNNENWVDITDTFHQLINKDFLTEL